MCRSRRAKAATVGERSRRPAGAAANGGRSAVRVRRDSASTEQPSGGMNISVGGEFLVFEGQRRAVEVNATDSEWCDVRQLSSSTDTHAPLNSSTGELEGLYTARDEIVGGFLDKLDDLAGTLAFEFNKVYSQGQGLVGFRSADEHEAVNESERRARCGRVWHLRRRAARSTCWSTAKKTISHAHAHDSESISTDSMRTRR